MTRADLRATDAGFAALKRLVIDRTGHHYYEDKDALLLERIRRRMGEAGAPDFAAYRALLLDADRGDGEWAALVAEITIGETFFFRFAEQFAALSGRILPEIVARNATSRRLRIWSAGAATGAEAYSVAILVHDLLGPALPEWTVSIVGTDINESFLAKARRAVYGSWALRSLGPDERARWFTPTDRRDGFALRPDYAALVRFERHNLLSLLDGTSPLQFTDFDLVLCRNVLIYFHPDTVRALVEALGGTLAPGGTLLLGHAEGHFERAGPARARDVGGTIVLRRPAEGEAPADGARPAPDDGAAAATAPMPVRRPSQRGRSAAREDAPARSPRPRPVDAPIRAPGGPEDPSARIAAVRDSADRGDLDAASSACRAALDRHAEDPLLHHLEGLVERARGRLEPAETAFRRALFLRRDFAMAHYHLGLTLLEAGRVTDGRRSVANAARLAALLPDDALLAEGDGLTASGLAALARRTLDGPPPPPAPRGGAR